MGFLHTVSKLSGNICQKSQIYPHRHRQLVHSDSIADTMVHHQVEQSTSSHSARWRSRLHRLHDYAKPGLALVTFWWHQFAGRWLIDDCNVVSMVAAVALHISCLCCDSCGVIISVLSCYAAVFSLNGVICL